MDRKIDLKNIFQVEKMEELLSTLIHQLEQQQVEISRLTTLCNGFVSQSDISKTFGRMDEKVQSMSLKIQSLEECTACTVGGDIRMSAGELSYLNSIQIEQIHSAMRGCARVDEIHKTLENFSTNIQRDMSALRSTVAPLDVTVALHQSCKEFNSRLQSAEMTLAGKMNRSEFAQIETLAARLEMFDSFERETRITVEAMGSALSGHDDALKEVLNRMTALESSVQCIDTELKACATKADCRSLARELDKLADSLAQSARTTVTDELKLSAERAADELASLQTTAAALQATQMSLATILGTKASSAELKGYVLRSHFDHIASALGEAVDGKCSAEDFAALQHTVQECSLKQREDGERLAVAVRFVDWFAKRGELYEHNMRIIDKHLGKLAEAALPPLSGTSKSGRDEFDSKVLPFDSHIRNEPELRRSYKQHVARHHTQGPVNVPGEGNHGENSCQQVEHDDWVNFDRDDEDIGSELIEDPTYLNWA